MHKRTASLSAVAVAHPTTVSLRSASAFSDKSVEVDVEKGLIKNAAIMTIGPTDGHGFSLDRGSLQQLQAIINSTPGGLIVRFKHPDISEPGKPIPDTLGTDVGFISNAQIVGDALRGDVQLQEYAKSLPIYGNVWAYLLAKAKNRPDSFGLSPVISLNWDGVADDAKTPVPTITSADAVDFVSKPAANPNGLLSAREPAAGASIETTVGDRTIIVNAPTVDEVLRLRASMSNQPTTSQLNAGAKPGVFKMNPKMKKYLSANHALAADASDEDAQKMFDALSDADKAKCNAAMSAVEPIPTPATPTATPLSARNPSDPAALAAAALQTQKALLIAEGERVTMLCQLGETLKVKPNVVQLAIAENDDVPKAQLRYLAALRAENQPVVGLNVRVGDDRKIAMLGQAMPDALATRAGYGKFYEVDDRGRLRRDINGNAKACAAHEQAEKYADLSALDMYRHWLIAMGAPADQVIMLSRTRLAQLLGQRELRRVYPQVAQLAQSSSDFSNLLLDAQNKTLRMGYVETRRSWQLWAKRGTAPDFKNINRVQWSEMPNLGSRNEGQPIQYGIIRDSKETYQLVKYDTGVKLTWQSLINDDMNVFGEIPFKLGQAGARLEDTVAYAVLTANAAMADTGLLFNSTAYTVGGTGHANSVTGTANLGAPSTVAVVAATEKLMLLQKGPSAVAFLDIMPKFCIVPVALKTIAQQFFASVVDPSKYNDTPNPYRGNITVIPNSRLDATSSTAWYLVADYRDGIDTVELSFLQDEPEPILKQESDFDTDDAKYAVRHTIAAKALEFRGMVYNAGA